MALAGWALHPLWGCQGSCSTKPPWAPLPPEQGSLRSDTAEMLLREKCTIPAALNNVQPVFAVLSGVWFWIYKTVLPPFLPPKKPWIMLAPPLFSAPSLSWMWLWMPFDILLLGSVLEGRGETELSVQHSGSPRLHPTCYCWSMIFQLLATLGTLFHAWKKGRCS